MICYKDMTFCNASCNNARCYRKLTTEVKEAAKKWWGSDGAPIAVSDYSNKCAYYIPEGEME